MLVSLLLTQPAAAQRSAAVNPVVDEFRQRTQRLIVAAASNDAAERTRATKTLSLLQQTLLETLTAHADDPDPEVRTRVASLLVEIERDIQETRAVGILGPDQRKKFDALRRTHPDLCRAMLSTSEHAKLSALRQLRRNPDRDHTHEPLALLGLHSRHATVQDSAIEAVMQSRYADPQIVHRLTDLALAGIPKPPTPPSAARPANPNVAIPPATRMQALNALTRLASPHAAGRLAAAACGIRQHGGGERTLAIADAAVASGDNGLLLALLPKLGDTFAFSTTGNPMAGQVFTQAPSDIALYMLLRMTRQPLETYGLQFLPRGPTYNLVGFDTAERRADAIAAYKTWWEQNKSRDTYKTATATPLPAVDDGAVEFID